MEMALLLKEGVKQVVLTPQTEAERKLLQIFEPSTRNIEVKRGEFYAECQGGWQRTFSDSYSVMLIIREPEEEKECR